MSSLLSSRLYQPAWRDRHLPKVQVGRRVSAFCDVAQVLPEARRHDAGPLLLELLRDTISGVALELAEVVDTRRFLNMIEGLEEQNLLVFRADVRDDGEDLGSCEAGLEPKGGEGVSI